MNNLHVQCIGRSQRNSMQAQDFLAFWNGRPKDKPLPLRSHGIYMFDSSGRFGRFVYLNPGLYRPVDWRGCF